MADSFAALTKLTGERILITGAAGSIGSALAASLVERDVSVLCTDVHTMDVTRRSALDAAFSGFHPTLVYHLAGAKHAPLGEEDPAEAAKINITGTRNVLEYAEKFAARVVTASTCKACNPETAYGATKLIAERMTLNAGGSVSRFYNVRESCGNVFELWANLPPDEPLPVTPCKRRFMSLSDAVQLLLTTASLPPGRYTLAGTKLEPMIAVAWELYPDRKTTMIPPRRGDRLEEPEFAAQETAEVVFDGIYRVVSPHDAAEVMEAVAA